MFVGPDDLSPVTSPPSSAARGDGPPDPALPDKALVAAALARLRGHRLFAGSPSLTRFLDFVVEETLAGRGDRLKAYTIATHALGRGADFDAAADPIVRVEATRLRRKLDIYYATDGADAPIRIRVAVGAYRAVFERLETPARPAEPATPLAAMPVPRPLPAAGWPMTAIAAALAIGLAVGLVADIAMLRMASQIEARAEALARIAVAPAACEPATAATTAEAPTITGTVPR
jgi:hypothetical protein